MRFIADYLPHCVGRVSLIPRGRGLVDAARSSVNDEVEAGDRRLDRFSRWKIKEQSVSRGGGKVNCLQLLPSNFFRSIHPPSFSKFFTLPFAMQILFSSEDNRTLCQIDCSSSREYLPAGSRRGYVFKITFLHRLAITATRYRPQHRLSHEARSLRNRHCDDDDDDDDDASLHLRAYLPRLLSISSIFLLRNVCRGERGWRSKNGGRKRERKEGDAVEAVSFIPI